MAKEPYVTTPEWAKELQLMEGTKPKQETNWTHTATQLKENLVHYRKGCNHENDDIKTIAAYLKAAYDQGLSNKYECNCGADRTGPSAEAHDPTCPQA